MRARRALPLCLKLALTALVLAVWLSSWGNQVSAQVTELSGTVAQEADDNDNLKYLLASFAVVWFGFFLYAIVVTRKEQQLRREIELLRRELLDRSNEEGRSLPH